MHKRALGLATLLLACPGCVLSLSPLPASYGPPTWQPGYSGPMAPPITSTPVQPVPTPPQVQAPSVDDPPPPMEVPDLRSGSRTSRPHA